MITPIEKISKSNNDLQPKKDDTYICQDTDENDSNVFDTLLQTEIKKLNNNQSNNRKETTNYGKF